MSQTNREERRNGERATTVLLVDDDPGTTRLLTLAFAEFGGNVRSLVATSGREVREILSREGDGESDSTVVVIDVDNDGFDGRGIIQSIRESEQFDELPIIVFSRNDHPDVVEQCYDLGATAYLVKPDDYAGLETVVDAARTFLDSVRFEQLSPPRRRGGK